MIVDVSKPHGIFAGAVGDGVADDGPAIAAAHAAAEAHGGGIVYYPKPPVHYTKSNTVTLGLDHWILGDGINATKIVQTGSAFAYQWPTGLVTGYESTITFERLTLTGKNLMQFNTATYPASSSLQGVTIRNALLLGTYGSSGDPNIDTAIVPTLTELKGYGVGVWADNCFRMHISDSEVQGFGIGWYGEGADNNSITNCRLYLNARHIHHYNHDTGGNFLHVSCNDILFNRRVGGIYLDGAAGDTISENFFESTAIAGTYITTRNDIGTRITENGINATGAGAVILDLAPHRDLHFYGNDGGQMGSDTIKIGMGASFSGTFPTTVYWHDNSNYLQAAVPDAPGVCVGPVNPYLFHAARNVPPAASTSGAGGVAPYALDAVTGRWGFNNTNSDLYLLFYHPDASQRKFLVRITGRKISSAGYCVVSYVENGTTVLADVPTTFRNPAGVETIELPVSVTIPDGKSGRGRWQFELDNTGVDLVSLELIPVGYEKGPAPPSANHHNVGDYCRQGTPRVGRPKGWVCTAAGTPGTWVSEGNL